MEWWRMFSVQNRPNIRFLRPEEYQGVRPQCCTACLQLGGVQVAPVIVCVDNSGTLVALCGQHFSNES